MSKRRRFILTSILLTLGFIGIQFLTDQNRFWSIGLLGLLTAGLFIWSFWGSIERNMTLLTLVLPTIFTVGVGIFWFLLPTSIYTRIPIMIFYGIGIYVLCLTMNIYSVATNRTIALLRAARGVGFVLTLLTSFLVFDAIISLKTSIYFLVPLVFFVSFPLYLQGFWAVVLEKKFSRRLFSLSLIASFVTGEIATALYFWPVTVVTGSLFLTVTFYMILGLVQAYLEERLFSATIREHLTVGLFVFVAMFFATHWGG
jgi:hypothetical protein